MDNELSGELNGEVKARENRFIKWVEARDDDWWDEYHINIWDYRVFDEFQTTEINRVKRETTNNSLIILDRAELEKWFDMPDTTENWRTWKRIRNAINDQIINQSEDK